MKLTKKTSYQYQSNSMARQDKLKNAAMQKYNLQRLMELVEVPEVRIDRSQLQDIDQLDFHDFKWTLGQEVEIMDNRFAVEVQKATVGIVLDEMINVKFLQPRVDEYNRQQSSAMWINTDPCKIYPSGFFENQDHIARVAQIEQELKTQHRLQMQQQQQNRQMAGQDDDDDEEGQYGSNMRRRNQGQNQANYAQDSDDDNDELYGSSPNTQGAQNDDQNMSGDNADSDIDTNN